MTYTIAFLILLLTQSVISDQCFKYVFGDDFENSYTNTTLPCSGLNNPGTWTRRSYSNSSIERPDAQSEWYISPSSTFSCITSSFPITLQNGGRLKVHLYVAGSNMIDFLTIKVFDIQGRILEGFGPMHLTRWQTVDILILDNNLFPFQGYIAFMGSALKNDVILVDSFWFVPPNTSEESCILYKGEGPTTTTTTEPRPTTTEPNVMTNTTDPTTTTTITTITTTTTTSITTTTVTTTTTKPTITTTTTTAEPKTTTTTTTEQN